MAFSLWNDYSGKIGIQTALKKIIDKDIITNHTISKKSSQLITE